MNQLLTILRPLLLILLLIAAGAARAEEYAVDNLVNPNIADAKAYVCDPAGLLNKECVTAVNSRLWSLRQATSAEMAVVVLPSIGDETVADFSVDLFEKWGIGKSDNDNGVLFLLVLDQKEGRITTGYGVEGVLPDALCSEILNQRLVPAMKEGRLDDAVEGVADTVAGVLTDPASAEEIRSKQKESYDMDMTLDKEVFRNFIMWMAIIVTIGTAILFFAQLYNNRRRDSHHRALNWRSAIIYYIIGTVCSFGGALVFLLLACWMMRRERNRKRVCPHCGEKMHKLSEQEDNARLSPSEDLEERIGSVDYDVWECPQCGAIDKYAFPRRITQYSKCPNCGTVAMREVGRFTRVPATTRSAGVGDRVCECLYCRHQKHEQFTIPKKEDAAALAAVGAAAALGRAGRRGGGGFGGGSFGGGFGGGHTGGGGASGRW